MMRKILLCLVATLFISPVFADVHKWKDANGKTHYGDAPPIADTAIVKTDKQTDDEIANGERIKAETENSTRQDAMNEARDSAKSSGKCKDDFEYYARNDDRGKQLALAAKEECLNNEALKKTGQSSQVSLEAYNAWKDQHNEQREKRQNAQAQRQQRQLQQKLGDIERKTEDIRNTQRYGY